MTFGRILRDTNVGRDQVKAGDIVEVDDSIFAQLQRARAIEKCDPPEGAEEAPKKAAPKFRRHSAAKKEPEPAAAPASA